MNISHLNLTYLESLCDDTILIEVSRGPKHGELQFVKDSIVNDIAEEVDLKAARDRTLRAAQFHSGRHLIYRHNGGVETDSEDEIVLHVCSLKEKHKRSNRLRVPLPVHIYSGDKNVNVNFYKRFQKNLIILRSKNSETN